MIGSTSVTRSSFSIESSEVWDYVSIFMWYNGYWLILCSFKISSDSFYFSKFAFPVLLSFLTSFMLNEITPHDSYSKDLDWVGYLCTSRFYRSENFENVIIYLGMAISFKRTLDGLNTGKRGDYYLSLVTKVLSILLLSTRVGMALDLKPILKVYV